MHEGFFPKLDELALDRMVMNARKEKANAFSQRFKNVFLLEAKKQSQIEQQTAVITDYERQAALHDFIKQDVRRTMDIAKGTGMP